MAKAKIAEPSPSSKILVVLLIVVSVAFIIGMGARTFGYIVSQGDGLLDDNAYQSITLTDGSRFYGNIDDIGPEYIVLDNAHYSSGDSRDELSLKPVKDTASESTGSVNINRAEVVYWENLQTDGVVTKTLSSNAKSLGE